MKIFQLKLKVDPTQTIKILANHHRHEFDYFRFIVNNKTVAIIPDSCLNSLQVMEMDD